MSIQSPEYKVVKSVQLLNGNGSFLTFAVGTIFRNCGCSGTAVYEAFDEQGMRIHQGFKFTQQQLASKEEIEVHSVSN